MPTANQSKVRLSSHFSQQIYSSFFFSSRRRHTRSLCDWSSDVCSSDLSLSNGVLLGVTRGSLGLRYELPRTAARTAFSNSIGCAVKGRTAFTPMRRALAIYSSLLFAVSRMLASRDRKSVV